MYTALIDDFMEFAGHQLYSKDNDPVYEVLRELDLGAEFIHFYVAFYDLPSALQAWRAGMRAHNADEFPDLARLRTGVERRGLRGGTNLINHLLQLNAKVQAEAKGDWDRFCRMGKDWEGTNEYFRTIHGNGRWAAYKLSELCQKVLGYPLLPTDMGHKFSSSPRKGLALLFRDTPAHSDQSDAAIRKLDWLGEWLMGTLVDACHQVDIAQVETLCCDFHGLWKGGYYVGHDIDSMLESALGTPVEAEILEARSKCFPHEYLGELNGWTGVVKHAKRAYKDKDEIWVR
jgi:hypothetical protein